ncbi:MAG: hypothetical protein JWR07_3460 [Nevskia sp.]|nr:hypothetical protein [Nevskia sp.]
MRTALIIGGGLVLLGICVLLARWLGGAGSIGLAVKLFIPLWLALAAFNMWFGVARAGYAFMEELPIFLVIFAIPAVAAGWLWWRQA